MVLNEAGYLVAKRGRRRWTNNLVEELPVFRVNDERNHMLNEIFYPSQMGIGLSQAVDHEGECSAGDVTAGFLDGFHQTHTRRMKILVGRSVVFVRFEDSAVPPLR